MYTVGMYRKILAVCVLWTVTTVPVTHAAGLYLEPSTATLERGQTVIVSVRLNVDQARGECVNAIDGILEYGGAIEPIDTSVGNSIFPFWVESPVINRSKQEITFAGGIPNGYCGRVDGDPQLSNRIVDIVFRVPGGVVDNEETAFIRLNEGSTVYLNDGAGGIANTELFGADFVVATSTFNTDNDPWLARIDADTQPPAEFSITLNRDPSLFSNKYHIIFNTTDKQSGLSHYEVLEEPIDRLSTFGFGAMTAPWERARSPFVLQDQTLNSIIRVKAIDKAGNEYIASLLPDESLRSYSWRWINIVLIATSIIGSVVSAALVIGYYRRRLITKSATVNENYDQQ